MRTVSKRKQNQFKSISLFAYLTKLFINGNKIKQTFNDLFTVTCHLSEHRSTHMNETEK